MDKSIETHLQELNRLAKASGQKLYLVGGTVRDILLGNASADYDFTCANAPDLARAFAAQVKRPLVPLDDTHGRETFRVVIQKQFYFDFSRMQGNTIEEDLSRRDFTFNAMSIPLEDFLQGRQTILDPHEGTADLRNRIVRVLPGDIFPDDPLRMLRAFRFAGALQFSIENATLAKIAEFKSQINRIAPERIYYELSLFLEATDTHPLLAAMDQTGFLKCLIPEIYPAEGALEVLKVLDALQSEAATEPIILSGMAQSLGDKEWFLLKMAALLRRQEDATVTLKRLRASNSHIAYIEQTIKNMQALTDVENFTGEHYDESRIYRFTKLAGKELIPALLLAIASHCADNPKALSNPFTQAILKVYDFYVRRYLPAQEHPALLNGNDLIKQFNLSPSSLFKTVLDQVEEKRTLGIIKTRKEAEALAKTLIDNKQDLIS